jgi:hypothetical protein
LRATGGQDRPNAAVQRLPCLKSAVTIVLRSRFATALPTIRNPNKMSDLGGARGIDAGSPTDTGKLMFQQCL